MNVKPCFLKQSEKYFKMSPVDFVFFVQLACVTIISEKKNKKKNKKKTKKKNNKKQKKKELMKYCRGKSYYHTGFSERTL